jgi:hypothetical protein
VASSVSCQFDDDQMVTFSARGILASMRSTISSAILSEPRFTDATALLSTFPQRKFDVADCLGGDHPAALVEHAGSDHNSDVWSDHDGHSSASASIFLGPVRVDPAHLSRVLAGILWAVITPGAA